MRKPANGHWIIHQFLLILNGHYHMLRHSLTRICWKWAIWIIHRMRRFYFNVFRSFLRTLFMPSVLKSKNFLSEFCIIYVWIQLTFNFRCIQQLSSNESKRFLLSTALLSNFGLLIIDHIHFQYNGILYGILLLSISFMMEERFLCSAFLFAVLLNMKHIFVYISPIYIVYLLKVYCLQSESITKALINLSKLAAITIGVTAISFGPFYGNIPQVKR